MVLTTSLGALILNVGVNTSNAYADTVVQMTTEFTGKNIYSPDVLFDTNPSVETYVMWYGGEQASTDTGGDRIYYRKATGTDPTYGDPDSWGTQQAVITPSDVADALGGTITQVNDPSVTEFINPATDELQYTMFFTAHTGASGQAGNEVVSAESTTNGTSWSNYQILDNTDGAADPDALYDPSGSQVWLVYFSYHTIDLDQIQVVSVNDDEQVISGPSVAFTNPDGDLTTSPDLVQDPNNSDWYLFFDDWPSSGTINLWETVSSSNTSFTGTPSELIANSTSGPVCGTATPSALWLTASGYTSDYALYFGEDLPTADDPCGGSPDHFKNIAGWIFST